MRWGTPLERWSNIDLVKSLCPHYNDFIMGSVASQITSLTIVYPAVYSGADQRKHQSSASLAFVRGIHRGPVNSMRKWPVTRKGFPFDGVIMRGKQAKWTESPLVDAMACRLFGLRWLIFERAPGANFLIQLGVEILQSFCQKFSPVNSPHKGQWREALMFSLICAWLNGWVNNHGAGDLRRHRSHYDVIVMINREMWSVFCGPTHCFMFCLSQCSGVWNIILYWTALKRHLALVLIIIHTFSWKKKNLFHILSAKCQLLCSSSKYQNLSLMEKL